MAAVMDIARTMRLLAAAATLSGLELDRPVDRGVGEYSATKRYVCGKVRSIVCSNHRHRANIISAPTFEDALARRTGTFTMPPRTGMSELGDGQ